jgi:hypothetical protein
VARRRHATNVRPGLRLPGHRKLQGVVEAASWTEVSNGPLPEEAAKSVGVSQPVGS